MNPGRIATIECHGVGGRRPSHTTIACTNCDIYQTVEVHHDDGRGHAILQSTPCSVCRQGLPSVQSRH